MLGCFISVVSPAGQKMDSSAEGRGWNTTPSTPVRSTSPQRGQTPRSSSRRSELTWHSAADTVEVFKQSGSMGPGRGEKEGDLMLG